MSEEAEFLHQINVYKVKIDKVDYEVSIQHINNKIYHIKIRPYFSDRFSEITFDEFKAISFVIEQYFEKGSEK
jgi:hypothetical protein